MRPAAVPGAGPGKLFLQVLKPCLEAVGKCPPNGSKKVSIPKGSIFQASGSARRRSAMSPAGWTPEERHTARNGKTGFAAMRREPEYAPTGRSARGKNPVASARAPAVMHQNGVFRMRHDLRRKGTEQGPHDPRVAVGRYENEVAFLFLCHLQDAVHRGFPRNVHLLARHAYLIEHLSRHIQRLACQFLMRFLRVSHGRFRLLDIRWGEQNLWVIHIQDFLGGKLPRYINGCYFGSESFGKHDSVADAECAFS